MATHTDGEHPLTETEQRLRKRAAVLIITADRGLAGAYSSQRASRRASGSPSCCASEGMTVVPYLVGRKARRLLPFRGREVAAEWTGFSDQPTYADAEGDRRRRCSRRS